MDSMTNGNHNNGYNCKSLEEYILKLSKIHRDEIYELSKENGYPLNDLKLFPFYKIKSSLMKLIQIPSDSRMFESLALHIEKTVPKSRNNTQENREKNSINGYSEIVYFYLNIQVNNRECIHVRIYSNAQETKVEAIIYKSINDKLHQF